uniref:Ribonuclease H-like domain-containing protein n=1 Tax=Tanacetum cinerariifolium TaxID=118510 RepID=A0A6L2MBE6_TANCI|nr:ribonuclease H-like domain-containing protein [Tanacetum cinerariifolium]
MNENNLNDLHVNKSKVLNNVGNSRVSDGNDNQGNDMFKKGERYHAIPPSDTGNYMPPRADLSFAGLDNSIFKSKVGETITSMPKIETNASETVRRPFNQKSAAKTNNFNEKVNIAKVNNVTTAGPKAVVSAIEENRNNVIKSLACWIWRPKGNLIDHISKDSGSYTLKRFNYVDPQGRLKSGQGIFDSGCSRHMTGKKSYLTDYQEIDGGFIAFGGNIKRGKITRKGKIRTGKLDFECVYFVKELNFNLFSVSQICDKKNSVLFTNTECVVLSSDFKLLDESQVLLKVPRNNNMYSFDLKNVVPVGGLICLFANATLNDSNLWHRRFGHINFKTMNKPIRGNLVRGLPSKLFENDHTRVAYQKGKQHKASCIENQIDHKVKTIRCDNGTKFKNMTMNEFYEIKGIRKEFSVARTPHQNGLKSSENEVADDAGMKSTKVLRKENGVLDPAKEGDNNDQDKDLRDQEEAFRKQCEQEFEKLFNQGEAANTNSTNRLNTVSSPVNAVSSSFTTVDPERERAQRNEFESMFRQDKDANGNMMFTPVSAAGSTYVNLCGSIPVIVVTLPNVDLPTDPLMPNLEDTADLHDTRIFSSAYDDEVDGAVVNFNKLELTTVVSPIPTT